MSPQSTSSPVPLWKQSLGWDADAVKTEGAIASATVAVIMTAAKIIVCVFIIT